MVLQPASWKSSPTNQHALVCDSLLTAKTNAHFIRNKNVSGKAV